MAKSRATLNQILNMEQSPPSDLIARNLTPKERANVSRFRLHFGVWLKLIRLFSEFKKKRCEKCSKRK